MPKPGARGKKLTIKKNPKHTTAFGVTMPVITRPNNGAHSRGELLDF